MIDDYRDALDYLYSFANFEHERIEKYAPENISLARPGRLLALLGDPHQRFATIHIAGTKGKGSVAAMCAACLRASGLRVGLYTSPHLQEFRDRIRVLTPDDVEGRIGRDEVVELVKLLQPAERQVPDLTWFELVTAIAFLHFERQHVDLAVIEVGLGGRLDATNVLTPLVSVITSLSLDHTHLLGNTLPEIAAEKGGIIKAGIPVISAPQPPDALARLREIACQRQAPLTLIGQDWRYSPGESWPGQEIIVTKSPAGSFIPCSSSFTLSLAGRHQQENAVVTLAALSLVQPHFPRLTLDSVREGLSTVYWPGRLQVISTNLEGPTVLVDCAHNVDSAEKLARALERDYRYERLWLILGITVDKDVVGIMRTLLPLTRWVFLTASSHPRAASPEDLLQKAIQLGYEARVHPSVTKALKEAWKTATPDDLICVTGSIFVVGDLLNQWEGLQSSLPTGGPRPATNRGQLATVGQTTDSEI